MQTIIQNLSLITDLPEATKGDIENKATQLQQQFGLWLKIMEYSPEKIVLRAVQDVGTDKKHLSTNDIVKVVKATFRSLLPMPIFYVHPIPINDAPASKVDQGWIQTKMLINGIRLKHIEKETGINITELTRMVMKPVPLSPSEKAFFWFYFAFKEGGVV